MSSSAREVNSCKQIQENKSKIYMRKGIKECIFSLVCSYRFMLIMFRVFVSVDLFLCFSLVCFFCVSRSRMLFSTLGSVLL